MKQSVVSSTPKQSVSTTPIKQSVSQSPSSSPYPKTPSQPYSSPTPLEDPDDDPEETKQRNIDKIKKQQLGYNVGRMSSQTRGGDGDDDGPLPTVDTKDLKGYCAFCGASLQGQNVIEVGGKEFHPRCFVCADCRKALTGPMLTVKDRYYHPDCLKCKHCSAPLKGKEFVVNPNNKQVYCPEHGRLDKTGTKAQVCGACKKPLSGKEAIVNALHQQWHQKCFACTNCKEVLNLQSCVQKSQKPYCEPCYQQIFRTRCALCKQIISGQIIEIGPADAPISYHAACFKCPTCSTPLKGQRFFVSGTVAYCEEHVPD